ncbi:MAG: helix-turn-helix transcriptional regulator [Methyloceanibacter sp.]|uniref:helix-turn-helix transcriptional regulator n=1 Tax=Methyloceanibacter sp. TaxID=1965321 RepID=UPI003D6CB594
MREEEQLSLLIGDIYDATLDAALWLGVLSKIADFVGGKTAGLLSKDSVSRIGNIHYNFGVDEHYIRLYQETYWRFDPLSALIFYPVGQVTAISDVMPMEEIRETRFFREWVEPQGWWDAANVILEKSATSFSLLSVVRNEAQGFVDVEMRRRMRLVAPHVRRAVLISRVIELKATQADSFAEMLDALSAGMFLVDARGRIVHANAAGHAMLAEGAVLHAAGLKLSASDGEADAALHEAFMAAGEGDAVLGVKGIAMPLAKPGGERYLAHVLPLSSGARRQAGATHKAAAALFVHKAALDTPSMPEVIAKTYKLTPTELRVLLAIVEVGGVPEVAEALGSAETTVKTHLGRLYGKTGVRRQADLVKLVAGYSNPLVA